MWQSTFLLLLLLVWLSCSLLYYLFKIHLAVTFYGVHLCAFIPFIKYCTCEMVICFVGYCFRVAVVLLYSTFSIVWTKPAPATTITMINMCIPSYSLDNFDGSRANSIQCGYFIVKKKFKKRKEATTPLKWNTYVKITPKQYAVEASRSRRRGKQHEKKTQDWNLLLMWHFF